MVDPVPSPDPVTSAASSQALPSTDAPLSHIPRDSRVLLLGNGTCLDRHGDKPSHWNCQKPDAISAKQTCEQACRAVTCHGYQLCSSNLACSGLCVLFADRVAQQDPLFRKFVSFEKCSFVPPGVRDGANGLGTGNGAIEQIGVEEESMWKCFKKIDADTKDNTSRHPPLSVSPSNTGQHAAHAMPLSTL